ncbi:MAG TPA: WcaF family extracellular polysaccharide biosynthesis acetyltransferase [Verrucomicrobiae bacterium]|jgi:putative colanic acid biosynthesis acetyltransferase WcaF|nr:WcaF family extracellular polysaccharide biosynthesis acetyltransferase [Verrucomicrobiae bacterium]
MDTVPQPQINLAAYSPGNFDRGASIFREALWVLISFWLFRLCPFKFSALKRLALRCFGAHVGRGVIIKPNSRITFPWKLTLGNHVWLGEDCWLLNLAPIVIEDNVCISQRAFLCAGNHNYKSPTFDLMTQPIRIENGAWICANAFIGPGVTIGARSVVCAGSVVTESLPADGIFQGNPAIWLKRRVISSPT